MRSLINSPQGIALDAEGNVYLADPLSITKVEAASGSLTKLISFNDARIAGDHVAVDSAGNVFYPGSSDNQISRIDSNSRARTAFAGLGGNPDAGDGDLATAAVLVYPEHLSFDKAGNYFIADRDGQRIRRVDARTGTITTVAGDGRIGHLFQDNVAATGTSLFFPDAVVADAAGNVYFAETGIRKVEAATGKLTTLVPVSNVRKLALDPAGNLYLTAVSDNKVSKYDFQTRTLRVVAGTGQPASSGDGGPATQAALNSPQGIAFDQAGNLYIAEQAGNRIRKVDVATGIITTVASGLLGPTDVAVGSGGVLFVLQSFDIVRMNSSGGNRVTLAKSFYFNLFGGDNEPSTSAGWDGRSIALDGAGNLFVADGRNGRIRAIRSAAQATPVPANPRIDSIAPVSALPGSSVEIVIRGSNLSGTSVIGFSPGTGVSVTGIQSTSTQVNAVVAIASDAPNGIRQVRVTTAWGASNQFPFTIGPPGAGTHAPMISNLTASKPYAVSGGTAIDFAFDFTDADGDITSTGSLSNSAKVTLTRGGCTTNLTSTASLNKPGATSGKISFTYTSSNFVAGTITLSVKLTDVSGNASNTLTVQPESWICFTITNYELRITNSENLWVIRNS